MDAARYFEMMHTAMSAQKPNLTLLLTVKVQDLGGTDAYLELRQDASTGAARVFYSTMGRRNLNFQLFRKGWQLCHNASGEMTRQFPSTADELLNETDFSAYIRDDALDADRAERILQELHRCAGSSYTMPLSSGVRSGAIITTESFIGCGGQWVYTSDHAADCLPIAAILYWLGDFLAGSERRTLQSCPQAAQLAAQWQLEQLSSHSAPVPPEVSIPTAPVYHEPVRRTTPAEKRSTVKNERWQSILAVLATV